MHALKMIAGIWVVLFVSGASAFSSSDTYTAPICGNDDFYCLPAPTCLPRTQRCTGDGASDPCIQKNYQRCDYNPASGKFRVRMYTTNLEIRLSGIKQLASSNDWLRCLNQKREHHFVMYRGFMYEFGAYLTRVQDPNDPWYEYRNGGRAAYGGEMVGESSCTYEEVGVFLTNWVNYDLCSHNCQDFTKGLIEYLKTDCVNARRRRKRQSDEDFARYIFSIAGTNCENSLGTAPSTSTENSESPDHSVRIVVPLQVVFIAAGIAYML